MNSESKSIGSVLSQYLKERGLENIVKEASVPEVWSELIGESAARHCKVLKFENKKLVVQVDSSVWRSELRLRSDDLRAKINERLQLELVHEIVLR